MPNAGVAAGFRPWGYRDNHVLRAMRLSLRPNEQIAAYMGRSYHAIISRAGKLGLPGANPKSRGLGPRIAKPKKPRVWTRARDVFLKTYYNSGEMTAQEIADHLSTPESPLTRSMVIGRANRLGLSGKSKSGETRKARRELRAQVAAQQAVEARTGANHGVLWSDLKKRHCRWPLWQTDTDPRHYCGADRVEGSSYCAAHHAMGHKGYDDLADLAA